MRPRYDIDELGLRDLYEWAFHGVPIPESTDVPEPKEPKRQIGGMSDVAYQENDDE